MISTFSLHSYKLNKLSQPVDQFSEKEKKNQFIQDEVIRLETKSCRILPLTYGTKYDMT